MLFNSEDVNLSPQDIKEDLKLPEKPNEELAEETGIHIGDGSMNIYNGCYLYSLRGHKEHDKKYYEEFIPDIYKNLYNLNVNIRIWSDVIGFQKGSKGLGTFKNKIIGLPFGKKNEVGIPEFIVKKEHFTGFLRGLFDTDGCLNFEKKSKRKTLLSSNFFIDNLEKIA